MRDDELRGLMLMAVEKSIELNCVIPLLHTAISERFRGAARRSAIQIHVYCTVLYIAKELNLQMIVDTFALSGENKLISLCFGQE